MKQSRKRISKVKRISRKQYAGKPSKSCGAYSIFECENNGCKWHRVVRRERLIYGICRDK